MFSVLALKDGFVPATINYQVPDSAQTRTSCSTRPPGRHQVAIPIPCFGGNTCLVFQKWEG